MAEQRVGRYRLTRKIIPGDSKRGVPDLWQAEDQGDLYYAKLWSKGPGESSAIQALWNREVRGLMRLQGYPGASELFVKLRDLDSDDRYFFAILDGGRRLVLSDVLHDRSRYHWLLNLSEVGRRRPLWEGLLRIAQALAILHREGTLHRSLSPASVFVSPDGQGEFRLSGFEWSLRVAGPDSGASRVLRKTLFIAPELDRPDGEYSTATDWYDFGLTAAELFGTPLKSTKKRAALQTLVGNLTNLRESERYFILRLLEEKQDQRLVDAEEIEQLLRQIIRDLSTVTTSSGRDLVIAVRLGSDRDIARTIEVVSEGAVSVHDPIAQRDWIRKDLQGDVRVVGRSTPSPYYVLKGEKLEYRVRNWSVDSLTTWDVGFCEGIERLPRINSDDQLFTLGLRKLDVQLFPHVRKNIRSVRDRSAQWDKIFPIRVEKIALPDNLRTIHEFFRITQQLDTVLTVAQICAVEILEIDKGANDTTIVVTPAREPERADLARFLNLDPPPEQVQDWFKLGAEAVTADDEEDPKQDRYSFLERRTIGSDTSSTTWRFVRAKPHPKGPRYYFRAQGAAIVREGRAYLARNHGGTLAQIRRRHKAIEDMRLFEDLLRLVATPREVTRNNSDALPAAKAVIKLDVSKLTALKQLWKTQPSFAIQGPPGTGKTTLIKAFADRLFNIDSSAQILITAHSHHTVDDVRDKLSTLFADHDNQHRPIVLRLGADDGDNDGPEKVTETLLSQLHDSELARGAPDYLQDRLSAAVGEGGSRTSEADTDVRTMQVLVQDAANLTFSTLNSPDLADLAGRGRRFDWSIIEEAGKAHGFDMATALQESHRLLLIGDHHQLPPFNVRRFTDLLGDPLKVRKAIQQGAQFAPGLVDPSLVAEDEARESFVDRCAEWARMVRLFETIFKRSSQGEADGAPAAILTDQHRMHPNIAELVGKVFYPDPNEEGGTILHSPPETHERFEDPPPFTIAEGSWLPEQRVVWCDVPWERKEEFAEGEVEGLFISRPEAALVVKVLEQIRPRGVEPCQLQILSPYNGQLDAIRTAIERAYPSGQLAHMFKAPFDLGHGKRMGATVDEFQGSEADIVIVSLVRNNALVPWKSVGFLKEKNRMNVLLSRAKQKLVIVGSWDFFASRCNATTNEYDEHAYIGRMMKEMTAAENAGLLSRVRATK
ncbi:AAA domain-containing protein [Mesorhizobium sp.]|uniref:AAA domain-containing protein n=1 Tax=Mesorhizobium sp. TaxID=1871066 RepID=UPI000FE59CC3|nr:AAA domain-containing protein [Mesorhizobium sp.]RWA58066.1 MAG: AAA family ATPase [Mesorhizobium sp.]